jgi:hypothetical protein
MLSIIAGTTQDRLHEGLDFSPAKGTANYILDRKEVTIHPQSGGLFSNSGIRVIRFSLGDASNAFLCGETVRLAFYIKNNGTGLLTPIAASPASLFDRVRVLMGGVEVEDITYNSRFTQQQELLLSAEQRLNNLGETWCASSDATVANLLPLAIPGGEERRVMCQFHIAAFKQPKRWWLAACSIVLELALNPDSDYCFAGAGASWTISRPVLLASVFQTDPAMTSQVASYLSSGKYLTIMCPTRTYNVKAAITNSSSYQIALMRGFSKLACITFSIFLSKAGKKECVTFDSPLAGATPNSTNDKFGYWVSLGSSRWPTNDVEGVCESWMRTRLALSLMDRNSGQEISITPHRFRNEHAVYMVNLSKVLEDERVGHSGLSTMNGSNLVLHFKHMPDPTVINSAEQPRVLFVTCHYDAVVEIGKEGCRAYS